MFTHLFDQFVRSVGTLPIPVVYAIIAVWVGPESLGIPLPLELMLLFAGSLVGLGQLGFLPALFTVLLASLLCAGVAYFVGRRIGAHALAHAGRYLGLTPERVNALDTWLRQRGIAGVTCARIIPGVRLFSSYVMGIADIPLPKFVPGIALGTLAYACIWMLVGIFLGSNYRAPLHVLDALGVYGLALGAAAVIAGFVVHHVLGRHTLSRLAVHPTHPSTAALSNQSVALVGAPLVRTASQVAPGHAHRDDSGNQAKALWKTASTTPAQVAQATNNLDHRIANAVGLRGPALFAQVHSPWPSWISATLAIGWGALAMVVLLLSVLAHRYATFPLDTSLTPAILQLRGTVLAAFIYPAGDLQWYLPTAIAYSIIFAALLVLRLYSALLFLALSSFGADLAHLILNIIVDRPRPHGVAIPGFAAINLGSASFPSGHVAHVVGLYGFLLFLSILAWRARPQLKPWLLIIQALCVYFLVFVGFSRILEGQHWPSDVIAGYLIGIVVLLLVIVLYHRTAQRYFPKHRAAATRQAAAQAATPRRMAAMPQD
jgi:membrane protein DedA with SNARE-associated domain/membrane-associated phospholipid phosphatase